jgi:hypothetical protein
MATRKDFVSAAIEIKNMGDRKSAKVVAKIIARIFADGNPRFDFQRFYSACEIED